MISRGGFGCPSISFLVFLSCLCDRLSLDSIKNRAAQAEWKCVGIAPPRSYQSKVREQVTLDIHVQRAQLTLAAAYRLPCSTANDRAHWILASNIADSVLPRSYRNTGNRSRTRRSAALSDRVVKKDWLAQAIFYVARPLTSFGLNQDSLRSQGKVGLLQLMNGVGDVQFTCSRTC